MTGFSKAGLQARANLLDAAEAAIISLHPTTAGRSDLLANIDMARTMLGLGHVRQAHSISRDVCSMLEREGKDTANIERLSQIAHSTD